MTEKERILYIDDDVVVVNKLPGDVCSFVDNEKSDKAPYLPDVFAPAVSEHDAAEGRPAGKKPFLECVHRLDRPVSGCAVMARNRMALAKVSGQFTNHKTASKKYWAIVEGVHPVSAEPQLLEDWLVFDTRKQKTHIVDEGSRKAKKASLYWRCAAAGDRYSFIEVELLTGRTHQIRAQLANIGLHIKGDVKYGARRSDTIPGIRLHAREVSFLTPGTGRLIKVTCPVPVQDPLWNACEDGITGGQIMAGRQD